MNSIKKRIVCVVVLFVVVMINYILNIGCPFIYIFGIPCAGCGMTRAFISAMQLDFYSAFKFHPLLFMTPFMAIAFIFSNKFKKKYLIIFWLLVVILFVYVYFVKLANKS